jgi:hypothetical protein
MNRSDDQLRTTADARRRDVAGMTLGELLVAGRELRLRSQIVFDDMVVLEAALRKHLGDPAAARIGSLS